MAINPENQLQPAAAQIPRAEALVRLAMVRPIFAFMKSVGAETKVSMRKFGITERQIADTMHLVHVEVIYGLLAEWARDARDPWLGLHAGEALRLSEWPIYRAALQKPTTLAGVFVGAVEAVPSYGRSVEHRLEVGPERTAHRVIRALQPRNPPVQPDGFSIALHLRLLDQMEQGWDPSEVEVRTAYPQACPEGYRGITVTRWDVPEIALNFPTAWCSRMISGVPLPETGGVGVEERPSLSAAIDAVAPDLLWKSPGDLPEAIAERLGLEVRELEAALRRHGTSLPREIRTLRIRLAREALAEGSEPIARIGARLGYSEAASFTRFFKAAVGETPRAYRLRSKSNDGKTRGRQQHAEALLEPGRRQRAANGTPTTW